MKLVTKFFKKTWTGRLCTLVSAAYQYNRDYAIVSDTLYSKEFGTVLKRYLNCEFKKDWLGRLYGVLNPNIDINGKVNFSNVIIELDAENTNSDEYIKSWVYKQMQLIGNLFKIEKLYDYISIEFKHVGPITHDNYLVVFDITSRQDFTSSLKSFSLHTIIYTILAIIGWLVLL